MSLNDLFGSELDSAGVKVPVSELQGKYVAILFGAHWCGWSRTFSNALTATYDAAKAANLSFEIVFVQLHVREEEKIEASDFASNMPWASVPLSVVNTRESLFKAFTVSGIPQMTLLSPEGKMITQDCRPLFTGNITKDVDMIENWCNPAIPVSPDTKPEDAAVLRARL